MVKLLLGSPIRQRVTILSEFLSGLDEMDLGGLDVSYMFIDDNVEKESSTLLKEFAQSHNNVILRSSADYSVVNDHQYDTSDQHIWKTELIQRIIAYKNDIISYARNNGYDYLFFVDSDIIMNPMTIKHLISRNVDIISNIFWTQWSIPGILYPQVWLQDESAYYIRDWDNKYSKLDITQKMEDFFAQMRIPGMYKVGGLGACTLLSRKSIESGVNFDLIDNVSFWGEDRHFCIRARALGLGLYVDTVYPAYHIYREFYIKGIENYKKNGFDLNQKYDSLPEKSSTKNNPKLLQKVRMQVFPYLQYYRNRLRRRKVQKHRVIQHNHKLTLSMIVHNEEKRYLENVLTDAIRYVDEVLILDDASTDNTVALCERVLKNFPHKIVVNEESMFHMEGKLRKKQWDETIKMNPDWILFLDADEIPEASMSHIISHLMNNDDVDLYCFKLYDMWNEKQYRSDCYWNAHMRYMPFMLRYQPNFKYKFNMNNHHCGRMPMNIFHQPYANIDLRIKHYGWARAEDRKAKYDRYMKMDPGAKYGNLGQYQSIMDEAPHLVRFEDENSESCY